MDQIDRDITNYHLSGLNQDDILLYLNKDHNLKWKSKSTLKRRLRRLGLYRRKNFSDPLTVVDYLKRQLLSCNKHNGYRWHHKELVQNGYIVKADK